MKFKLGSKLKSVINGFSGIATARVEYLNGCVRYALTPKVDKDGKNRDCQYFDVEELEQVGKSIVKVKRVDSGGGPNPPKR